MTLAAGALVPAVAFTQDSPAAPTEADEIAEVVVTGSRIQRRDASAVGPLTTLTAEDIALAAPTSAGDLLQALPSVGVSLNSNGTQGTAFGVSSINLRYLGSAEGSGNRTLVLVDGHRWVNAVGGRGFRDFVDLNTIPLGIIERIEVLKDGASAIYGADAIAGVVNIQTRRNVEGLEVNARYGVTDRGDNDNLSGFVNWGRRGESSSLLLSLSYSDTDPVLTSERSLTTRALAPLTAPPTSPRCRDCPRTRSSARQPTSRPTQPTRSLACPTSRPSAPERSPTTAFASRRSRPTTSTPRRRASTRSGPVSVSEPSRGCRRASRMTSS
jgi:iron complex outermembrane recepter protein